MDRLERLVNLVVALLDTGRPLTRDELRERVGGYSADPKNFHRNFERDKARLREIGVPIVSGPVDPGSSDGPVGYRIPKSLYELPDPGLDEEELAALGMAASSVVFEGSAEGTVSTALWKLAASAAPSRAARHAPAAQHAPAAWPAPSKGSSAVAQGAPALLDMPISPDLAALFSAVTQERTVTFVYNGTQRRVDPYRLSYRRGKWYLAGFDHSRGAERLFRADRVQGPVELDAEPGSFVRPADDLTGPPPPWRLGDHEEVVVDLRVDASQAAWARAEAGPAAMAEENVDGSLYLKLAVTNPDALRTFVLGMLDHVEVLGPPEVRQDITQWLRRLAGTAG